MDNDDLSLPEGFTADEDGSFRGIPPWAMREANAVCASLKNDRSWDVPMVAQTLADTFHKRMNDILAAAAQKANESIAALTAERSVTNDQLNTPLDAARTIPIKSMYPIEIDEIKGSGDPVAVTFTASFNVPKELAEEIKQGSKPAVSMGAVVSEKDRPLLDSRKTYVTIVSKDKE